MAHLALPDGGVLDVGPGVYLDGRAALDLAARVQEPCPAPVTAWWPWVAIPAALLLGLGGGWAVAR